MFKYKKIIERGENWKIEIYKQINLKVEDTKKRVLDLCNKLYSKTENVGSTHI